MNVLNEKDVVLMDTSHNRKDVAYILIPNNVDVIVSDHVLNRNINPTSFAFVFTENGDLVLANNLRRGAEVAGGHIEEYDLNSEEGARREAAEETGAIVENLIPVGFFRSITTAACPDNYRYPHPVSCQQFFAGITKDIDPKRIIETECGDPIICSISEAKTLLKEAEYILYQEAVKKLFPDLAHNLDNDETFRT